MTTLKTMKDFDKELEQHLGSLLFTGSEFGFAKMAELKEFFHSHLKLLISEFEKCVPTHCICCEIQHTGKCSCLRKQTLKALEDLLR